MSKTELKIVHMNGQRKLGSFRVVSERDVITIGSSKNARIRVMNSQVDDIHTSIENRDGTWKVVDLASKQGTWIGKEQVVETEINGKLSLVFGNDTLLVEPVEVKSYNLYLENSKITANKTGKNQIVEKQQVVVLKGTEVLKSEITDKNKKIKFHFNKKKHILSPASGPDWLEDDMGENVKVKRRIIQTELFNNPKPKNILGYFQKDMIDAFGVSIAITLFFFLTAWLVPKIMPKDPGALEKNKYTRMIFDREIIQKQQKKAEAEIKKAEKKAKKKKTVVKKDPPKKKRPVTMPKTETAKKVVSDIRNSGLSKKISSLANKLNTKGIADGAGKGVGKSRNRSFASVGVAVKGARLSKNAGAYNVTKVSTNGVAGGTAVSGKLGGLSAGGVGGGGVVEAIEEETEISGGLDPAIIAKVVKDNIGRIRYCYERQLAAHPDLYGKVKVAWTITAAGSVKTQKIENSTMKNAMVEGCMLRQVARWNFPRPDGGGDVVVSYPFFFKATQ